MPPDGGWQSLVLALDALDVEPCCGEIPAALDADPFGDDRRTAQYLYDKMLWECVHGGDCDQTILDALRRRAARPALDKFNPNEPRDPHGEWTKSGGGKAATTDPAGATATPAAGQQTAAGQGAHTGGGGRGGASSPDEAQGSAAKAASGYPSLEGLPNKPLKLGGGYFVPGPLGAAKQAAEAYMKSAGLPYNPPKQYLKVDPELATRIATAFDQMPHAPDDPQVKAAYAALAKETMAQWQFVKATGLKVDWLQPGQEDPYVETLDLIPRDARENNHLTEFPTDLGYGTEDPTARNNNPMLQDTGEVVAGHRCVVNDIFRIVHDYFGHFKEGVNFTDDGEENAWRSHASMFSPLARGALTSETRGQASWVNHGPYAEHNRTASAAEIHYAPQKIGLMPEWAWNEGREDKPKQAHDAAWHEEQHKRGQPKNAGQFSKGGGGAVKAPEPSEVPDEVKQHKQFAGFFQRGALDPVVKPSYGNRQEIQFHPKPHPNAQAFNAGYQGQDKTQYYDPRYAELKTINAEDPIIARQIAVPKAEYDADTEFKPPADPNAIYRGISAEEYAEIMRTGEVKSKGEFNIGTEQEGLTYWTTDPRMADSYANGFAPAHMKPTFSHPAYIVATQMPQETRRVQGTGKAEVGVARPITRAEITGIWRGDPIAYEPGNYTMPEPGHWGSGVSGVAPSATLRWSQVNLARDSRPARPIIGDSVRHVGPPLAHDAKWDELKHPRGQPENKGEFASSPGGGAPEGKAAEASIGAAEHPKMKRFSGWQIWGASHGYSHGISGEAAKRLGFEHDYKPAREANRKQFATLANKFLQAVSDSPGSPEKLYHGFQNIDEREFKKGDKVNLSLTSAKGTPDAVSYGMRVDPKDNEGPPTVYEFPVGTPMAGYAKWDKEDAEDFGYTWDEALVAGKFEVVGTRKDKHWDAHEREYTIVTLKPLEVFDPGEDKWRPVEAKAEPAAEPGPLFKRFAKDRLEKVGFKLASTDEKTGNQMYEYYGDVDLTVTLEQEDGNRDKWTLHNWNNNEHREGITLTSLEWAIEKVLKQTQETKETTERKVAAGQKIAKPTRRTESGGLNPRQVKKAHDEVKKLTMPVKYYNDMKEEAYQLFKANDVLLDVKFGGWEPDKFSLREYAGSKVIEPGDLKPELKEMLGDLRGASVVAFDVRQHPDRPLSDKQIKHVADIVTKALGYDPDKLSISHEDKEFTLNGETHKYAGAAFRDTGKIVVYAQHADKSFLPALTAHETMHCKWQQVLEAYQDEKQMIRNWVDQDAVLKPDDSLRPEYAKDYPVYAALQPVFDGPGKPKELADSDGTTPYSQSWWKAFNDGEARLDQAYHETLAEISKEHWENGRVAAAPPWRKLYSTINKLYAQGHYKPRTAQDTALVDLKVNIRAVGPPRLGLDKAKAKWDESKHPRGQPENAGEWAKVEGGPKPEKVEQRRTVGFVSPSTASHLDFTEARSGLVTKEQRLLAKASHHIDAALGLKAVKRFPAIGAWADGAENSMVVSWTKSDLATARAAMAMKGYLTNQKAVVLFQPDKNGHEVLATFSVYGNLQDIHNNLLQHGVAFHTLEPLASGDGAKVHVYASDQATVDAVDRVGTGYGVTVNHVRGQGEFIGTDIEGTDEAQRADARRIYEEIIREAENSSPLGGKLGSIWRDARNSWGAAAKAAATGRVDPLPGSKGGSEYQISTRRPGEALPYEDSYRRADMAGWQRDPDQFRRDIRLLNDPVGYPNLRPAEAVGDPDDVAKAMIAHSKANLRFLYDNAPNELRDHGHQWYEGAHEIAKAQAKKYKLPLQSVAGVYASQSPQKLWDMNVYLGDQILKIYFEHQHTKWDKKMDVTGHQIWKNEKQPQRDAELKRLMALVHGKTLAECDGPIQKAMWIRTYNEAHTDRQFPEVSPAGERGKTYLKDNNEPWLATWASNAIIANAIDCIESNGDRDVISDAMGTRHKVRSFYNNIIDPNSPNDDVCMDTHAVGAALLRPIGGTSTPVAHSLGLGPKTGSKPKGWIGATSSSVATGIKGTYPLYAEATRELAYDLRKQGVKIDPRTVQSITWEAKRGLFDKFTDRQKNLVDKAWSNYHNGKAGLVTTQKRILRIAGGFHVKGYAK